MPSDHSLIAPSSASVWGGAHPCTGSPWLVKGMPESDNREAADEGNAVHWIAEQLNVGNGPPTKFIGQKAPNGVLITEEMTKSATLFSDYVRSFRLVATDGAQFHNESKFSASRLVHPELYGTADATLWEPAIRVLRVFDLKNGFVPVETYQNRQLVCYAACVIDTLGLDDGADFRIELTVFQPRAYKPGGPASTWRTTRLELEPFLEELRAAALEVFSGEPKLRTGEHCRFCPAKIRCKAAIRGGLSLFETVTAYGSEDRPPEDNARLLTLVTRAAEQLKYVQLALSETVEADIRAGKRLDGWNLKPGGSNLKWDADHDTILALGKCLGVDLEKKDTLTPTQAIAAGVPEDLVKTIATRPPAGLKLTQENASKAALIFSNTETK